MPKTKVKCLVAKCKNPYHFPCIGCKIEFCPDHLLFLKGNSVETADASKAQCVCCFFGLKRTKEFVEFRMMDFLAEALLKEKPEFRERVFDYRRKYEKSEDDAFAPGGPDCWYPTMAPVPTPDVKAFIVQNQ